MDDTRALVGRRAFLQGALATGAGAALAGPFSALAARTAGAVPASSSGAGYGPLVPARDQATGLELLLLPRGFEYLSFGWTNDLMSDGRPTPSAHDGMAAFRSGGRVRLVRNHERGAGAPFASADRTYDPAASGGTTTLVFDPDSARLVESYASLSGTIRNCAGGPTPQGTWLSCEETTDISAGGVRHSYVFEVPSEGPSSAVPLKAMGRFSHEATATDPATGTVYPTEDAGSSALYRFRPVSQGNLAAGGILEAMKLAGTNDTRTWATGMSAAVDGWVNVDNPDWGPGEPSTWAQVSAKGAARISRGEGAWYGNGVVYVVSTNGGLTGQGQVFAHNPAAGTFTCVFASPSSAVLNATDNVCVSPRRGLVLCEGRERAGIPAWPVADPPGATPATSATPSGPAPRSSPRTATGCSPTCRARVSPSPSPGRGSRVSSSCPNPPRPCAGGSPRRPPCGSAGGRPASPGMERGPVLPSD